MNVLFIHSVERGALPRRPATLWEIQLGISYISAVLKEDGHATELLVLRSERPNHGAALAVRTVKQRTPGIVAFTSVSTQHPFIDRVAREIRRAQPDAYLVIGGPHVSLNPEEAAASVYDAVCVGEGEYPMKELVAQLASGRRPSGVPNMWLRREGGWMEQNPTRPFMQDLDALPFPDRDMWRPWIDDVNLRSPSVLLGRGCPYNCTHCSNHALARLATGTYARLRSPESIVSEIEDLRRCYLRETDQHYVYLEVETIALNKAWTLDLCEALRRHNSALPEPLTYHCNYRIAPQSLDEEIFRALAAANCRRINIGLEAGSERVRREVLKREYSNDDFRRAVDMARRHGLEVNLYNMIGLPGETLQDHMETVRLNREARPEFSYTSIFFPYPGTELHRRCEERGLLSRGLDVRQERKRAVLDLPEFPRRQVQRAYDLFDWRIREGHWPQHVRVRKLVRQCIGKWPPADRAYRALLPAWRGAAAALKIDRSFGRHIPT